MAERANGYGLLAEFSTPEALLDAARQARAAGYRRVEAYTPFPIEGLAETIGFRETIVPWLGLIGGIVGALIGYGMQAYVNFDYPLDAGGRPVMAVPAFLVVTFELTILFAVLFAIGGMLILNRLPRLSHPLFEAERFHLASVDRFFLCIRRGDDRFHPTQTGAFLQGLHPISVTEVPK